MDSVVHFEMPYDDAKRMTKFYQSAFGWKTQELGEEMGNYVLATTADSDEQGAPKETGRINGGLYPKKSDYPAQYPTVVIAVDDINGSMAKVSKAGGKLLGEPVEIPGIGHYVSFTDTEGNRVAMLQPFPRDQQSSSGEGGQSTHAQARPKSQSAGKRR